MIKQPAVFDVSHWKIVPDFNLVSPRPVLVLTKATEDTGYIDPTFLRYFDDMKQDGIARGCYHFFRKAYSATEQARFFVQVIKPYVTDKDILVLDFEEGGETAAQLLAFLGYVRSMFPRNLIMVYGRKNLMDPIPMTQGERDALKRYPVWVAGYPYNPDLYPVCPSFYVPDTSKWGPVYLWQYTDHGQVTGISGDVDCNWIHPTLFAMIGNVPSSDGNNPPTETGATMQGQVLVNLNIRKTASTLYPAVGQLAPNDIVEGLVDPMGWWSLQRITRAGVNVPLPPLPCFAYGGASNGYIKPLVAPPVTEIYLPDYIVAHFPNGETKRYLPE